MRHRFEHDVDAPDHGLRREPVKLAGLDWRVPDFSTLSRPLPAGECVHSPRGQRTLAVNIPYRGSRGALHLLVPSHGLQANHCRAVDSTGIKAEGEGEWHTQAWRPQTRVWRKIHLGIDEQTLEIQAVESSLANGRQRGRHRFETRWRRSERASGREPHRRRAGAARSAQPDPT